MYGGLNSRRESLVPGQEAVQFLIFYVRSVRGAVILAWTLFSESDNPA
jgi:hypothetical protein